MKYKKKKKKIQKKKKKKKKFINLITNFALVNFQLVLNEMGPGRTSPA